MIVPVRFPAAFLVALLATAATAQDESSSCFCLAEPGLGSVAYNGCKEATPPTRVTPVVQCAEVGTGVLRTIRDASAFERLPAGEAACNPCRPRLILDPRATRPRGDDDEPATR